MTTSRNSWTAWATILACGLMAMAPWLALPFDGLDVNAGTHFGVFARNWDHLGWLATRGLPLLDVRVDVVGQGTPYVNHPPLTAWLLWLGGSTEWQMRLTSMLATLLGALALRSLLVRRFGAAVANLAACVHLALPLTAIMSQTSYEAFALPIGLTMFAALVHLRDAEPPRRIAAQGVAALCAFLGVGFDWSFGAFCIAAVPLTFFGGTPIGRATARLAPAGIAAGCAVACVLLWKAWIAAAPHLPDLPATNVADIARTSILENRPPLAKHLAAAGTILVETITWPVLVASALGLIAFLRRDPRLVLALALAGALWPALYATHVVLNHRLFFAYLAPLFATAAACAVHALPELGQRLPRLRFALSAILVLLPLAETWRLRITSTTDYYAVLGRVMSAAAEVGETRGALGERTGRYTVAQSLVPGFGYYYDTRAGIPTTIRDTAMLRAGIANLAPEVGARYVWIVAVQDPPNPIMGVPPGMTEFLAPFPRERIPELEGTFVLDGPRGETLTVREAWLYTLKEPAN